MPFQVKVKVPQQHYLVLQVEQVVSLELAAVVGLGVDEAPAEVEDDLLALGHAEVLGHGRGQADVLRRAVPLPVRLRVERGEVAVVAQQLHARQQRLLQVLDADAERALHVLWGEDYI